MNEELVNKLYNIKEKIFSFVNEAESLLNRVVLLSLVVITLLWLNFNNIIELLVSEESIKQNLIEKLSEATGKEVIVEGDVVFKTQPEPVVSINKIKIKNKEGSLEENFVEIENVSTKPSIFSAILGRMELENILIENVKINVISNTESKETVYQILDKTFSKQGNLSDKNIVFSNLSIRFLKKNPTKNQDNIVRVLDIPTLELIPNPEKSEDNYIIKGSVLSTKFNEKYFFNLNFKQGFGLESDYKAKLYSTNTDLNFSGKINTTDKIAFYGKMEGKIGGFTKKIITLIGFPEDFLEKIRDNEESIVSANYSYDGKTLNINDFNAESRYTNLTIGSKTEFGQKSNTNVTVSFSKLDYSQIFKSRIELLSEKKAKKIERDFHKKLQDYFLFSIGDDVNFSVTVNIPKIDFFHSKQGSLYLRMLLRDGQFSIPNFKARLPGDSVLDIVAVADINKQLKQLKGVSRIRLIGKKLDHLNLALDPEAEPREDTVFGNFFIDAKGFLYEQNIHFREIIARFNEDSLAGQMMIDYSKGFNATAAFNFTNIDVNKYIEVSEEQDSAISTIKNNNFASKFDFLRVVDSVFDKLDIAVSADRMVRSGHDYTDVSIFGSITPGITDIRDFYFNSELMGEVIGKVHLDLTDFQPKINVDLNIDKYDLDLLIYDEVIKQDDEYSFDGKWSNEKVTFEKLGSFLGELNLKIDHFKIYHFDLKKFAMKAKAETSRFNIEKARANVFGNKVDFKGFLTTEFPSFSISFESSDLNTEEFMEDTLNLDQLDTKFNMSGVLSSSGYSIEQMIQNLKGSLTFVTKGFTIKGFDLEAVSNALPLAKRREFIRLISSELLTKGSTNFGFLTGVFNINNGQIKFENLPISGKNVRGMNASGVIDLPRWEMSVSSAMNVFTQDSRVFLLKSFSSGKINQIKTEWDTTGMMEYWEEKFYGGN
jgi:hypothetical protein